MDEQPVAQPAGGQSSKMLLGIIIVLAVLGLGFGWWRCWHDHRHMSGGGGSAVATCSAGSLALSMGASDGTAGTIYRHAVITNHGSAACTLTGYPAAFLLSGSSMVLGSGAAANPLYMPSVLTLAAHTGQAHAVLGFPDAGNFNPGVCSANAASLELFLPGVVTPVQTALTEASCPGFSVTALQPGA